MIKSTASNYSLKLCGIRQWIHIGCTEGEKVHAQPFDIDITIHYTTPPLGCTSDQLEDASCYKSLVESLAISINSTRYNLIERLAWHIHTHAKGFIHIPYSHIEVTVTKLLAPVPYIQKGVSFTYLG